MFRTIPLFAFFAILIALIEQVKSSRLKIPSVVAADSRSSILNYSRILRRT